MNFLRRTKSRGEQGYWKTLLDRTNRKPDTEFYSKAVIYAHLGDTTQALNYLEKSYNSRGSDGGGAFHAVDYLLLDEYWDYLHENPRFKALVQKLGYPNW
jgi:hypothetical protein